jgi:Na+/melibiose symporter-like transporter
LVLAYAFLRWEAHVAVNGIEPLVEPALLQNRQLTGGLTMFFFQYLIQMGVFFVVPLYLSVALGLSALRTGAHLLPLSLTLLAAAIGVPKLFPHASPRFIVRLGVFAMLAGAVVLMAALDADADAGIVTFPLMLVGLGIGLFASQLGAVTVSAVPDKQSAAVGGVQNTATNLGASIGTALAGSIMITVLTSSFLANIADNPAIPPSVTEQATVHLEGGAPFMSDAQLNDALEAAGAGSDTSQAALDANAAARLDGLRASLGILAGMSVVSLFFVHRVPTRQPGRSPSA